MFDIAEENALPLGAKIKVVGVGGGGCNAVNTMIRSGLTGVEYIVANTDSQALAASMAGTKIQLGGSVTKGLGAGANPEVGRKAAIEDYEKLSEVLEGADMVFVTAGMGGGTGTGAAPVIAKLAREMGALTVGVVTKPFAFEGKRRSRQAEEGIRTLEESVDSLISIPNQRLLQLAGESLSLVDTFRAADEVLLNAVQGISDLINNTGLINADFADVATVMTNKGLSLMGTGVATGENRAVTAAKQAISSPLLEDISIDGATGIIINITGGSTLTTFETNQAVTLIMEAADEDAEIIFGTVIDDEMGEDIKVTVIATGLRSSKAETRESAPASMSRAEATTPAAPVAPSHFEKPAAVYSTAPEAPAAMPSRFTDHAVKSEMSFNTEKEVSSAAENKINWAEKLQSAANRYESTKSYEPPQQAARENSDKLERSEFIHNDPVSDIKTSDTAAQNRENRIKSIAEKLGFFNFDEDEFDTPSFMKKNDRQSDSQI
jgi:cell division protein FtsZ